MRVNNIPSLCLFYDLLFFAGKTPAREKKRNFSLTRCFFFFFSSHFVPVSRRYTSQQYNNIKNNINVCVCVRNVLYAITLCIKNKNRRARKETVRHQFLQDRPCFFFIFRAIKSPSPPPPPSALLLLLPRAGFSDRQKSFRTERYNI